MHEFNNEVTEIPQKESLFKLPEIPQSLIHMGVREFSENFGEIISGIVDKLKDTLGITNMEYISDIPKDSYMDKASEVLREVFTRESICEWPVMTMEKRAELLNNYANKLGTAEGINIKGIMVSDLYAEIGEGVRGMNDGKGILYLDYRLIQDPLKLGEIIETTVHEARHQLQFEAISNPEKFDFPANILKIWEKNFTHYVSSAYDFEAYFKQPVEADARKAAALAVQELKDTLSAK